MSKSEKRHRLEVAVEVAEKAIKALEECPHVQRVEVAGSVRRIKSTVGDVDLVVAYHACVEAVETVPEGMFGDDPAVVTHMQRDVARDAISRSLAEACGVEFQTQVNGKAVTAYSDSESDVRVELYLVPLEGFGAGLLFATGSPQLNITMRNKATGLGLMLNQYGLWEGPPDNQRRVAGATEEEVLAHLGMAWIDPIDR